MTTRPLESIVRPLKILLARALFDNAAEFPSELSFTRGDVLTVLERNPSGYEGWWICSLNGKVGIAPGNRMEILGQLTKNKKEKNTDIYDDPNEWNLADELKSATTRLNQTSITEKRISVYDNLDFTQHQRTSMSGLTDSGNFSNRSSDASLSLQSSGGIRASGYLDLLPTDKTTDSQFDDYEDLDAALRMEPMMDSQTRQPIPAASSVHTKQGICQTELGGCALKIAPPLNDFNCQSTGIASQHDIHHAPSGNLYKSDRLDTSSPRTHTMQNPQDKTDKLPRNADWFRSVNESDILEKGFFEHQQNIYNSLTSKTAFTQFFTSLQKRIRKNGDRTLEEYRTRIRDDVFIHANLDAPSKCLIEDLLCLRQLCTVLVIVAKSCPDVGLLRRFVHLSKTVQHILTSVGDNCEHFDRDECKTVNDRQYVLLAIETNLKSAHQAMTAINTIVLGNAALLFRPQQVQSRSSSKVAHETQTIQTDGVCNSVPHVDCLVPDSVSPKTAETLTARDSDQMNELLSVLEILHQDCIPAQNLAQEFAHSLQMTAFDQSANTTEHVTGLDSVAIDHTVKAILHKSTEIIRSVAQVCSIAATIYNSGLEREEIMRYLFAVRTNLESKGSTFCESLKNLIMQTKETTKYSSLEGKMPSEVATALLSAPSPLLQKLSGASHSVCVSLDALSEALHDIQSQHVAIGKSTQS